MKKKWITAACLAVACTSLAVGLTACKSGKSKSALDGLTTIEAFYEKQQAAKAFTTAEKVTSLEGYDYRGMSYGDFVKFTKMDDDKKMALLNVNTGKVLSFENATGEKVKTWNFYSFYTLSSWYGAGSYVANEVAKSIVVAVVDYEDTQNHENDYTKSYLYLQNGDELAVVNYDLYDYSRVQVYGTETAEDEYTFTFSLYDDNMESSVQCAVNEKGEKTEVEEAADNDYFKPVVSGAMKLDGTDGYLRYDRDRNNYTYYNANYQAQYVLNLPDYATLTGGYALGSGKFLMQYREPLADTADKYDLLIGSTKCALTTVIVDFVEGKTKDVDFKFYLNPEYVESVTPAELEEEDEVWTVAEDVVVYITGFGEIDSSKRVDYENSHVWLAITADGKVKKAADLFENIDATYVFQNALGDFIVEDKDDRTYVVSQDGTILRELNEDAIRSAMEEENAKYYQLGDEFYDVSFNKVYTLAEGYEVVTWLDGEVILAQTVEVDSDTEYKYYFLNNGELKLIADTSKGDDIDVVSDVVVMVTKGTADEHSYTYYNTNGEKITSINDQMVIGGVIDTSNDGKTVYCSYAIDATDSTTYGVIKLSK